MMTSRENTRRLFHGDYPQRGDDGRAMGRRYPEMGDTGLFHARDKGSTCCTDSRSEAGIQDVGAAEYAPRIFRK